MKKSKFNFTIFIFLAVCVGFSSCNDDDDDHGYNGNVSNGNVSTGDFIDLGLSVKWASCNVGASSPSEYGGYYTYEEAIAGNMGSSMLGKTKYHTSGLYLGVKGFNDDLYSYSYNLNPFRLLRSGSKSDFQSFVNGLKMAEGTLLYYGVDEAINDLEKSSFPDDLSKVAIVTFTDGLDLGSIEKGDKYESSSSVSQRLKSTRVDGKSIDAYAIGVKGSDVNAERYSRFQANLKALSSTESNAIEVADMSEVNAKFQEIATSLYNETQTLSITIVTPGLLNGERFRFTFDGNRASATSSSCYIEGVWDRTNNVLSQVTYVGLKSSSGSRVSLTKGEKISYSFTLQDVVLADSRVFDKNKIQMWLQDGGIWGKNSEFNPSASNDAVIKQKSAVIMLVLDCSSSLGSSGLQQIKTAANNFISTLATSVGNQNTSEDVTSTLMFDSNGDFFRLPTYAEYEELIDECTWTWTSLNSVWGCEVKGPNGNSIFLPAEGHGYYWSAAEYGSYYPYYAYFLSFGYDERYMNYGYRSDSLSVRLVKDL